MPYYSRAVIVYQRPRRPPLPEEPLSLLYHRRRRIRKRAHVRLSRRFRQWCRKLRDSPRTDPEDRADYLEECSMSIRELVELDGRADIIDNPHRFWTNFEH